MKAEEIYFLNYVKTKILPKYNLTEEQIAFDKNEDYFVMRFILNDSKIEKMLENIECIWSSINSLVNR